MVDEKILPEQQAVTGFVDEWQPRRSLQTAARWHAAILIGFLVILGATVMYFVTQARIQVSAAFETVPPVVLALEARPQIEGLLLDVLRYSLTRDEEGMIEALRARLRKMRRIIRDIEAWLDAEQYQDELADEIVQVLILLRRAEDLSESLLLEVQQGRWDSATRIGNHLNRLQGRLAQQTERVLEVAMRRQKQALDRARVSMTQVVWVPGVFAGIVIVLLAVQTWLFQRRMIQPLLEVVRGVRRYAQGDWRYRLEARTDDEIGLLVRVFNQMADEVEKARTLLEQQVQERTYALQRRMAQTHTAADIGRAITMERDLDRVLQTAVDLVAQRFGFYQVGVFLLDPTGQWAVLQAASSPGGKRLVERGFRLRVGEQGIVGYVAHTGQVRVVEDVTEDPFYLYVAEWQETRSEMALPLRVGDEVLGVLDIQSQKVGAFHPDDIATLRIVADLLAVAVYNARLFQQQREALKALEHTQRLLTAQAWEQFVNRYLPRGYRYIGQELHPLPGVVAPQEVLKRMEDDERVLRFPVELRGQQVALLELERPQGQTWNEQEKTLARDLVNRLALALDHARLFMYSQRRLAWLHKVAEMARLWELKPVDELVQDLTGYMQQVFGWPHVMLYRWDADKEVLAPWGGRPRWSSLLEMGAKESLPLEILQVLREGTDYLKPRHPWSSNLEGTWVVVPLFSGEQVMGLLEIGMDTPAAFVEEDLPVLHLLAEEVASALENARLFQLVQNLLAQHQRLQNLMVAVMQAETESEAMTVTVDMLQKIYPETSVALYRYDENTQILRLHHHSSDVKSPPSVLALENTLYGKALRTGQPIWMNVDPMTQPYFWAERSSLLLLPLRYGEMPLGLLILQRREFDAFPSEERELFTTLSYLLAVVYRNLRLVADLNKRSRELRVLYEFAEALSRHTRTDELLQEAVQCLREIFDSLHCGIALFDASRQWSTLAASASRTPEAPGAGLVGIRFPHEGDESIQRVKRTKEILTIYNVEQAVFLSQNIREILKQRGTKSLVIAPLLVRGEVVGTVALDLDDPRRRLTKDELNLLRQLVTQISGALERVQLLEALARRAEREHFVREMTTRLRATTDPDDVLRIALTELRRVLQAERVQILLMPDTQIPSDGRDESE